MNGRVVVVVGLACALGACFASPPDADVAARESAIYHGSRARGYLGTVRVKRWVEAFSFGSCSGTVVAPHVVITARHCIEETAPSDLAVETGLEGELGQFGVAEIRTTEGPLATDNDFAILLTEDRVEADVVPWADTFDPVEGASITLVGYGKTEDALLQIGMKYVGSAEVDTWTDLYFVTRGEQNGCYGDSGGTGLDADGRLVGVITHVLFGPDPDDVCEGGRTGLNRVDPYGDMIAQAIEDAFTCEDHEACGDDVDDDCDGRTDDGCSILGHECADAVQCASGDCRAFGAGPICTQVCTPGAFPPGCPEPLRCEPLPGGSGACLDEPPPEPPERDAGVDSGPDAGTADTATYGCGCRTASTGRRGEGSSVTAIGVAAAAALRRRRRRSVLRSTPSERR